MPGVMQPVFYLIMAVKLESSGAGNLNMSKRSFELLLQEERMKGE